MFSRSGVPSLLAYLPDQLACVIANQRASRALRALAVYWPMTVHLAGLSSV